MVNGEESRDQPWRVAVPEPWTNDLVVAQHTEALWLFGESALFTMMWRPEDYEAGLVDHCSECMGRSAMAFKQAERKKCLGCFGTTFEGGIKWQVVRPSIFADRNIETNETPRGFVKMDSIMVETTTDFEFRKGDYIFRADGSRYQAEEKGGAVLRTGFALPQRKDSFRGTIPAARLEDPTAVAYLIPPVSPEDLADLLGGPPRADDQPDTGGPLPTEEQVFAFADPEQVWVVDHDLNTLVPGTVVVTDLEDQKMLAEVDYISPTRLVVNWPEPMSGKVRVRP